MLTGYETYQRRTSCQVRGTNNSFYFVIPKVIISHSYMHPVHSYFLSCLILLLSLDVFLFISFLYYSIIMVSQLLAQIKYRMGWSRGKQERFGVYKGRLSSLTGRNLAAVSTVWNSTTSILTCSSNLRYSVHERYGNLTRNMMWKKVRALSYTSIGVL